MGPDRPFNLNFDVISLEFVSFDVEGVFLAFVTLPFNPLASI